MKAPPSEWNYALIREAWGRCSFLPPCKNTVKRPSIYNQRASSHQIPNLLVLWSWNSQPPKLCAINFVIYELPSLKYFVFCYRRPNRLRQMSMLVKTLMWRCKVGWNSHQRKLTPSRILNLKYLNLNSFFLIFFSQEITYFSVNYDFLLLLLLSY